jgi:hypothetical protein
MELEFNKLFRKNLEKILLNRRIQDQDSAKEVVIEMRSLFTKSVDFNNIISIDDYIVEVSKFLNVITYSIQSQNFKSVEKMEISPFFDKDYETAEFELKELNVVPKSNRLNKILDIVLYNSLVTSTKIDEDLFSLSILPNQKSAFLEQISIEHTEIVKNYKKSMEMKYDDQVKKISTSVNWLNYVQYFYTTALTCKLAGVEIPVINKSFLNHQINYMHKDLLNLIDDPLGLDIHLGQAKKLLECVGGSYNNFLDSFILKNDKKLLQNFENKYLNTKKWGFARMGCNLKQLYQNEHLYQAYEILFNNKNIDMTENKYVIGFFNKLFISINSLLNENLQEANIKFNKKQKYDDEMLDSSELRLKFADKCKKFFSIQNSDSIIKQENKDLIINTISDGIYSHLKEEVSDLNLHVIQKMFGFFKKVIKITSSNPSDERILTDKIFCSYLDRLDDLEGKMFYQYIKLKDDIINYHELSISASISVDGKIIENAYNQIIQKLNVGSSKNGIYDHKYIQIAIQEGTKNSVNKFNYHLKLFSKLETNLKRIFSEDQALVQKITKYFSDFGIVKANNFYLLEKEKYKIKKQKQNNRGMKNLYNKLKW